MPKALDKTNKLNDEQRRMVEKNIGLAYDFSYKMLKVTRFARMSFDDILASAFYGLVTASRCYNKDKGIAFSTYVWTSMFNNLRRDSLAQHRTIWIPFSKGGASVVCKEAIKRIKYKPILTDRRKHTPTEIIDTRETGPSEVDFRDEWGKVEKALNSLPVRWRSLLEMRLSNISARECGVRLGCSTKRIYQLEQRILHQIRVILRKREGKTKRENTNEEI